MMRTALVVLVLLAATLSCVSAIGFKSREPKSFLREKGYIHTSDLNDPEWKEFYASVKERQEAYGSQSLDDNTGILTFYQSTYGCYQSGLTQYNLTAVNGKVGTPSGPALVNYTQFEFAWDPRDNTYAIQFAGPHGSEAVGSIGTECINIPSILKNGWLIGTWMPITTPCYIVWDEDVCAGTYFTRFALTNNACIPGFEFGSYARSVIWNVSDSNWGCYFYSDSACTDYMDHVDQGTLDVCTFPTNFLPTTVHCHGSEHAHTKKMLSDN